MSENNDSVYGFEDDKSQQGGGLNFGLNAGVTFMKTFQFNPNGGKDGAEQEALDIVFNVDGRDVSYRMFPVTKAYDNNVEVTDVRHPAMKQAIKDFNSIVVHVLHAFVKIDDIKTALSIPISSFKQFCDITKNILPSNFSNKQLDIFAQWQWSITGDNDKTYPRLPKNMKHGKWLCAHLPPLNGKWDKVELNGKLAYKSNGVDAEGKPITLRHPFSRTKWFMDSNFAEQQKDESLEDVDTGAHTTGTTENQNWE